MNMLSKSANMNKQQNNRIILFGKWARTKDKYSKVCLAQRYKEYIRSHSTEIVLFMHPTSLLFPQRKSLYVFEQMLKDTLSTNTNEVGSFLI